MADAVKLNAATSLLGTVERDATSAPGAPLSGRTDKFSAYNESFTLNASSTPALTELPIDLSHTLSGGTTKDFDLTAAPLAEDITRTVDLTGFKLLALQLIFLAANNTAGVAFGPQGANGYDFIGSGIIPRFYPGARNQLVYYGAALATPAVAAGEKDLRFTGTDGDGWSCIAYFGT